MTSYFDPITIEDIPRIEKVCKECGEESIFIPELIAYWSVQKQEWTLSADVDELIAREEVEIWCSKGCEGTGIVDVVIKGGNRGYV